MLRAAPTCPHCSPGAGRHPALSTQRSAPSAQHPAPSTQPAEPRSHSRCLSPPSRPAGCEDQPAAKPQGLAPGSAPCTGGLAVAMEARPAWSRQAAAQDGLKGKKRGRNEPRKPRGEGFVGTGGRGFPPSSRGGRQAPAAVLGGRPHEEGGRTEGP